MDFTNIRTIPNSESHFSSLAATVQSTTVFRPLSFVSLFVSRYIKHTPGRCTATAAVARLVVCHMFYACLPKDRRWARYANLSFGPALALKSHQQLYTSLSRH